MYKEVKLFKVLCDGCGVDSTEDLDYWAFFEKDQALYEATEQNWEKVWEKIYCTDCWKYDDENEIVIKNKWRIIYNFWERKDMDYAPRHFKTKDEAEKYIIGHEWTYTSSDKKFIIEKCF